MRKLETLFKDFINAPIQIYSGAIFKKGLYDLTEVYDNTVSGDIVIVKGNHNIGNNSIQLKDGVNWEFIGNPKITTQSTKIFDASTIQTNNVNFNGTFKPQFTTLSTSCYLVYPTKKVVAQNFKDILIRVFRFDGNDGNPPVGEVISSPFDQLDVPIVFHAVDGSNVSFLIAFKLTSSITQIIYQPESSWEVPISSYQTSWVGPYEEDPPTNPPIADTHGVKVFRTTG